MNDRLPVTNSHCSTTSPRSDKITLLCAASLVAGALAGCVSTATSIVKAPFKVAGKAVDWTTTSQEESDRNYGRKMRKQEAKEGRERRDWEKRCRDHRDQPDCREYTGYRAGR